MMPKGMYFFRLRRKLLAILTLVIAAILSTVLVFNFYAGRNGHQTSSTSGSVVECNPTEIPEFSGTDFCVLEGDVPGFSGDDFQTISGKHFSELDRLGRCGVAYAKLDRNMMPTDERKSIGSIKPSGWCQEKYEGYVDSKPPYLYNRCHLIAYALCGENSNERNLITGTRYFNVNGMLPFEKQVMEYLDTSDNHVLYRVTPLFNGSELVARGVEMEAYSVEDKGKGICFHVFIYNQQPGITIDYMTGASKIAG